VLLDLVFVGHGDTSGNRTTLTGDKGTQRQTVQGFETMKGTKNREPQCSSPNQYVPCILPNHLAHTPE
jgi:hypothetical protein